MVQLEYLVSAFGLASLATAAAVPVSYNATCKNPIKRVEWRQLSIPERRNYIDAVLCLQHVKPISKFPNVKNRYDDFHAIHQDQTDIIHFVAQFLPWHRYFVAVYERTLREECGYKGAQPYWDYTLDAEPDNPSSTKIFETEIFDPDTGFGGNGVKVVPTPEQNPFGLNGTGGGCVQDGPFVPQNFKDNYPGPNSTCLRRDFIPELMNTWADPAIVERLMETPDYVTFDRTLQGHKSFSEPNVHGSGHFGVGGALGQAGDAANSPAEPLFFLHHCNLDWIFWKWQQKDLKTRLHQVGGNAVASDYTGKNVTLDFKVNIGELAGNVTLGDLLNTQGETLCYTY